VVDDRDPLGDLVGFLQVLGGEQHRGAERGDLADQLPHVAPAARVQARRGLIEEQQLRGHDQAGPDVQPTAHPARIGADQAVGSVGQAEGGEQVIGALPAGSADPLLAMT
jgi:hypothetical protein